MVASKEDQVGGEKKSKLLVCIELYGAKNAAVEHLLLAPPTALSVQPGAPCLLGPCLLGAGGSGDAGITAKIAATTCGALATGVQEAEGLCWQSASFGRIRLTRDSKTPA